METDSEPRPFERVIDPYWVLGVGRDASAEQIDVAYRRAAGNAWSYERRREIESDPAYVASVLRKGNERANEVAEATLDEVRNKMGMTYP